jgi:hypothetical protein
VIARFLRDATDPLRAAVGNPQGGQPRSQSHKQITVGAEYTPPLPPVPGTCATPDPFVEIPGLAGICIDGNWIPTEIVVDNGMVRFRPQDGGFWVIEMDDGRVFVPMNSVPAAFQSDGLRVAFTAKMRPDQASIHGAVIEITAIN